MKFSFRMKRFALSCGALILSSSLFASSFNEVWTTITANPYDELPQYTVTSAKLIKRVGRHIPILQSPETVLTVAARRTLEDKRDIIDFGGQKLFHPNGICLRGTWNITQQGFNSDGKPYTGGFSRGSVARLIARASTALSPTKKSQGNRAFGMALKLFYDVENPTHLIDPTTSVETANIITADNLGGSPEAHYTTAWLSNKPVPPGRPKSFEEARILDATIYAFGLFAAERQVYPISWLGVNNPRQNAVTPKYIAITKDRDLKDTNIDNRDAIDGFVKAGQPVDADDFRDELKLNLEKANHLYFGVYTRNDDSAPWHYVGYLDQEEAVASSSCDGFGQGLHFRHPVWVRHLK